MTFKQVYDALKVIEVSTGVYLPMAYYQFPDDDPANPAPAPPFAVYYYTGDNDLKADDKNYQKIRALTVELYTDNKDFDLENTVETALTAAGFVYSKSETYIDTEKLYMVSYYMEVIING